MAGVVQMALLGENIKYDIEQGILDNSFGSAANAYITLVNQGDISNPGIPTTKDWITKNLAGAFASNIYVYANVESGSMTGGTYNTWLQMNTSRTWWLYQAIPGSSSATVSFQYSTESDGSVIVFPKTNVSFDAIYDT